MKTWTALCLLIAAISLPSPSSSYCLPPYAGTAACISPYSLCPQLCRPRITICPAPLPPIPRPITVTVPPPPPSAPVRIYVRPSAPPPPKIPQVFVYPPPPPMRLPAVIWLQPLNSKPWGPCVPVRVWGTTVPGVYHGAPCPTVATTICSPKPCPRPC